MPSDIDDYVGGSDDDIDVRPSSGPSTRTDTRSKSSRTKKESGFEVSRTWEKLTEGADGTITGAVEGLLQAGKRQRLSIPRWWLYHC
jgi:transcription initiation factor TFIIH subunit 2